MKNNKYLAIFLCTAIILCLVGCNAKTSKQNANPPVSSADSQTGIVTTNVKERGLCFSIEQEYLLFQPNCYRSLRGNQYNRFRKINTGTCHGIL